MNEAEAKIVEQFIETMEKDNHFINCYGDDKEYKAIKALVEDKPEAAIDKGEGCKNKDKHIVTTNGVEELTSCSDCWAAWVRVEEPKKQNQLELANRLLRECQIASDAEMKGYAKACDAFRKHLKNKEC